jgi:hypothetical protein
MDSVACLGEVVTRSYDEIENAHWHVEGESSVREGDTCPLCSRRVPHAKKPASPKTKVFSVRIPVDDSETFTELVDATAEHLGIKSNPHHRYAALTAGLVLALQGPANVLDES